MQKAQETLILIQSERKAALILSKSIFAGKEMVENGETDANAVVARMKEIINSEPLAVIDYVEMVNMDTMKNIDTIEGSVLCAIAVKIGKTRLIDNFISIENTPASTSGE